MSDNEKVVIGPKTKDVAVKLLAAAEVEEGFSKEDVVSVLGGFLVPKKLAVTAGLHEESDEESAEGSAEEPAPEKKTANKRTTKKEGE